MSSVFVVFSGEYHLMEICTKHLEGKLPVFRIDGVFSDEKKCLEWIETYSSDKITRLLSYIKIPIDTELGHKETDMEVFNVRMNKDLQITDISLGECMPIPDGQLYHYEVLENGEIYGSFWARDFIDACKLSYIHVLETLEVK